MPSPRDSPREEHKCPSAVIAAQEGHDHCLRNLTREELLKKDEFGETAAHHAARAKHTPALRYLCETVPGIREISSELGELPAHISVAAGDEEAVELVLAGPLREVIQMALQRDVNGTSLLMAAAAKGDNQMSARLLKRFGKSLATLPNATQMLPIHVAAAQGNLELLKMLIKFDSQMVNARDEFGCTPSIYAAQAGCSSCIKFLIETGHSEIGIVNNRGQSLLHIASLCGHENIARWLLERMGHDAIGWKTSDEATAIHCAAYCGSTPVLRLLLDQFSSKKRKQKLAAKDSRGNTPLHLAAIGNHAPACLLLIEYGADLEVVNASGHSPVGIASVRGYHELAARMAVFQNDHGKRKILRPSSASSGPALSPIPRTIISPVPLLQTQPLAPISTQSPTLLTMSPKLSSGYSSGGEENKLSGFKIAKHDCFSIVERHRMKFLDDGSVRDCSAQTEDDALSELVKVLDDVVWEGLGLSAVEHIDRVLDEVEELQLSPSL